MRKIAKIIVLVLTIFIPYFFVGCDADSQVVRIHIRANSNSESDQRIKLSVRDKVVDFIGDIISDCDTSTQVLNVLESNLKGIENIANDVLKENGYTYSSSASIDYEYFPSRDYDGVTFPSDYYNALIVKLGSGTGDNWWCVAYPPLCFVGENTGSNDIKYKSKLLELLGLS